MALLLWWCQFDGLGHGLGRICLTTPLQLLRMLSLSLLMAQYGGIVPPSKWKSQSLIGKVIASLQRPLEAPVPIETWGWTSRCACAVISALELRMHIGWSSLKNKLFKRDLSIRNNIHGAVHFRDCCRFEICNLIVSSASSFWDFRIPPFI